MDTWGGRRTPLFAFAQAGPQSAAVAQLTSMECSGTGPFLQCRIQPGANVGVITIILEGPKHRDHNAVQQTAKCYCSTCWERER